jgi:glycosyltransferase involved in cell wall biosynthesis
MKICILAPENSPSWGGVGAYTYNLARSISHDNEVHIVTVNRPVSDSLERIVDDSCTVHNIANVKVGDTFFFNSKFQFAVLRNMKRLDRNYQFDIIHSHSGHVPHLLSQFQDIAPSVVTVHATSKGLRRSMNETQSPKDQSEILMRIFSPAIEAAETVGFRKANRLLPVSRFTQRQIEEDYGYVNSDKTRVLHNAVDPMLFSMSRKDSEIPTLAFVGRLYSIKGIDCFLDAVEILAKKRLRFRILIVGRGETDRVSNRLSRIMPPGTYEIMGRVEYCGMPQVYSETNVLVVSSVYENCPTTILEAMSSGTLVVASDAGGISEVVKDGINGYLFRKGDSSHLARILEQVLLNEIDIERITKRARKDVIEEFNWQARGREILEEYRSVSY